MDMKNTYDNLNVFITDEEELSNFKRIYEIAIADTPMNQVELLARAMYVFGKIVGEEQHKKSSHIRRGERLSKSIKKKHTK